MPYARVKNELPIIPGYASGDIVTIDAAAAPLNKCVVDILPVQSGTGDPSPTNIRPISGWSSVNVTRTGKNLLKLPSSPYYTGTLTLTQTDNGIAISGTSTSQRTITLFEGKLPLGTSIIKDFVSGTNATHQITIAKNGTTISYVTTDARTITVDNENDVWLIRLYIYPNNTDTLLKPIMVIGSAISQYEPYNGTTANIPLGSTYYGGSINVTTGVLTVTHKYMVCSKDNQTWNKSNYYDGSFFVYASGIGLKPSKPFICSHLASLNSSTGYAYGKCFADSALNLWIMASGSSLNDFKDYLDAQIANGTPVTICGELETPTTVQLTPTEVKTILGNNNIFADSGEVEVVYRANGELYVEQH